MATEIHPPTIELAKIARKSSMLYEAGARNYHEHVAVLNRLHRTYWAAEHIHINFKKQQLVMRDVTAPVKETK